jgi:hypothetical protein
MTEHNERPEDVIVLLALLDEADLALRGLYRALADDPDLAFGHEARLHDLRARRKELAERIGLSMLAQHRASNAELESIEASTETTSPAQPRSDGPPPEPPVSTEAVDQWKIVARTNGLGHTSYEDSFVVTWETTLDKLMVQVGAPRDLEVDRADELDALDAVSRKPLVEDWSEFPQNVQRMWLGMMVARTRAVKDMTGLPPAQRSRVKTIISRYPVWAAAHQPGHVHGLKMVHEPEHGTWTDEARQLWTSLNALLADHRPTAKKAMSKKKPIQDGEPDEGNGRAIDPTWALWPLVRGHRAVIVGGDPREPNRERLERLFEFSTLEWPNIDGPRRVDGVVARIKQRTVDIVIVLKAFVDHKQSEPIIAAAKDAGISWALSDSYGAASVKAAFDRFLAARG